jgi:hypothetical protein
LAGLIWFGLNWQNVGPVQKYMKRDKNGGKRRGLLDCIDKYKSDKFNKEKANQ